MGQLDEAHLRRSSSMSKFDLAAEHISANASALDLYEAFDTHRRRLTAFALAAAPAGEKGSLCVLGAGNCFDLDLVALVARYDQVHLVDIDAMALQRAVARQPAPVQTRLVCHAPVDLSGLFEPIERWARFEVAPDDPPNIGASPAASVRQRLGPSFDVVLSACMLSQMQLSVLHALGQDHRLFQAVRWTLNLTHFRTLAELTKSGGTSLFATDVTSDHIYPLQDGYDTQGGLAALEAATQAKKVFDFADPVSVAALLQDDPVLKHAFSQATWRDAWLWTNGPLVRFLVYGCQLSRV